MKCQADGCTSDAYGSYALSFWRGWGRKKASVKVIVYLCQPHAELVEIALP